MTQHDPPPDTPAAPAPANPPEEPDVSQLRFEQAIERLEGIIERVESGEAGLEESLRGYEAGMKLIRRCETILDAAEQRIRELTAGADGTLSGAESSQDASAEQDSGEASA